MALCARIDRAMGAKYLDIGFCQVTECIASYCGEKWGAEMSVECLPALSARLVREAIYVSRSSLCVG